MYSSSLAKNLQNRGLLVSVITVEPEDASMEENLCELGRHAEKVITVPRGKDERRIHGQIAKAIISLSPHIVIPNYRTAFYHGSALAVRETDARIIGVCHNDYKDYYRLLMRYSPVISSFICAARKTKACLERILGRQEDIHYIPHGVEDLAKSAPMFEGGEIRLLYHGRIVWEQKCLMEMLKIAGRLLKEKVAFKLALVGDGANWEDVQRKIQEWGLSETVTLHRSKTRYEIGSLLSSSHLAILTSKYEGFCLSLAEAMLAGLPAVIFACGGVAEEYVKDGINGFVRAWGDTEGLSSCIAKVQKDPNLWRDLSRSARCEISGKFGWERAAESYDYIFREALEKPYRTWRSWHEIVRRVLAFKEAHDFSEHLRSLLRGWVRR